VAGGVFPRHARVIQESGLHLVEDPGSTYGTKLNGAKLEAGELFPCILATTSVWAVYPVLRPAGPGEAGGRLV
jgi:pSer/pThr/pTyr-binding forkhead associated (FHA) protein